MAKKILFVVHNSRPAETKSSDKSKLIDAVVSKWGHKDFHILFVNTWPAGGKIANCEIRHDKLSQIEINYPYSSYVWHDPKHRFTVEGHKFEMNLLMEMKNVMR